MKSQALSLSRQHALAQLLIHAPHDDALSDIFDSEDALMAAMSELAEGSLEGQTRRQLLDYLNRHSDAYDAWLLLTQQLNIEATVGQEMGETPAQAEKKLAEHHSGAWVAGIRDWLTGPFSNAQAGIFAFSMTLVVGMLLGWQLGGAGAGGESVGSVGSNESSVNEIAGQSGLASVDRSGKVAPTESLPLALNTPLSAPAKASIEKLGARALADISRCLPSSVAQSFPMLCYTHTEHRQHWYWLTQDQSVQLLDAPLKSGVDILDVKRFKNHVALVTRVSRNAAENDTAGALNLRVFDLQALNQTGQWTSVFNLRRSGLVAGSTTEGATKATIHDSIGAIKLLTLDKVTLRYQVTDDGEQRILEYHWPE